MSDDDTSSNLIPTDADPSHRTSMVNAHRSGHLSPTNISPESLGKKCPESLGQSFSLDFGIPEHIYVKIQYKSLLRTMSDLASSLISSAFRRRLPSTKMTALSFDQFRIKSCSCGH